MKLGHGSASCRRLRFSRGMRGQSMVEFAIVIPVLLLLALGILQLSLFFIAKATLNQAAFSGARDGAVNNASLCAIRLGVVKGIAPLYQTSSTPQNVTGYASALANAWAATMLGQLGGINNVSIDMLNPSSASFSDFQQAMTVNGDSVQGIPNSRLLYRDTTPGGSSNQSIQDANLLKIRVHYCYKVIVPPVSWVTKNMTGSSAFDLTCYADGGVPIQSDATVLMQSPAVQSSTLESLGVCNPF